MKTLFGRTQLVVIFIGCAFSVALLFYFILKSPIQSNPVPLIENAIVPPEQESIILGLPTRLKIPGIDVDAAIEYVGLAPDGAMDIPKGPSDVGWFELGPRPGENGSAVMAGHYGIWKNGEGSVFDNLHKLISGDKLYIEDEKGAVVTFVVRESRRFDPKADAKEVFSSSDEKAHLNLITCEGTWNKVSKSYSQRLVVFADKE
jgi:LPXTG-site transpeptidase (sortase) family protein